MVRRSSDSCLQLFELCSEQSPKRIGPLKSKNSNFPVLNKLNFASFFRTSADLTLFPSHNCYDVNARFSSIQFYDYVHVLSLLSCRDTLKVEQKTQTIGKRATGMLRRTVTLSSLYSLVSRNDVNY